MFTVVLILILRPVLKMDGLESLWKVAKVLIGLGFVIFIHELGHFLIAKWCDVHVQTFSVGFGPALPGCSFQWGETTYKIAFFPLGGYVKMVGEGTEEEENADDPRSFKKKMVGQRMAIISAGVIMNVILAAVCFSVVYEVQGVKRRPAEVASVEPGSPAWQKGLRSGALIEQIGDKVNPYFDDLAPRVMYFPEGQQLTLVYALRPEPDRPKTIQIEPRLKKGDNQPLIGVSPPDELMLGTAKVRPRGLPPVLTGSAAARATPAFEFGDRIIASTDPDNPAALKPLPPNPFDPDRKPDYYELYKRLVRLAGKPMTVQVRRQDARPDDPPVNIVVPPSYHYTFGMRMRMGQITAVREGSPAAAQGVRARDVQAMIEGDVIKHVEVIEPDGSKTRFITSRGKDDPTKNKEKVKEVMLDPLRLPEELAKWAEGRMGRKKVGLTVYRGFERQEHALELDWDDSWKFSKEVAITFFSPWSIPELGIAYRVQCRIEAIEAGSPAAKAGLKEGDVIEAIRFQQWDEKKRAAVPAPKWVDLELDQWAGVFEALQSDNSYRGEFKEVTLRVKRDNRMEEMTLTAQPDSTWPMAARGLVLMPDYRLQKATGLGDALALGFGRTYDIVKQTLQHVRAMITGRVAATEGFSGPITIGVFAYHFAGEDFFEFLNFLGIISVSLAVINFLPIPLLDGGHMAFLIYEKIRGKPAPEQVQLALMYLGLLAILSLMFFAFYVDWQHWNILKFLFGS